MGVIQQFQQLLKWAAWTFIVPLCLFNGNIAAQTDTSQYSYVNVISKSRIRADIFIGGQSFGKISFREVVKVKVYSKGALEAMVHVPFTYPLIVTRPFEGGKDVYFLIEPKAFTEIDVELAKELMGNARKVIELEEDLDKPLFYPHSEQREEEQEAKKEEVVVNDFCYVNFLNVANFSTSYEVYVNGRLMSTIGRDENLRLKVYSEGRLSISTNNGVNVYKLFLDAKNNEEYFVLVNLGRIQDDESISDLYMKDVKNTIERSEDPNRPFNQQTTAVFSQGTCFLVDQKGYLLTNEHVVSGAEKISIKGIAGDFNTWHDAKVVAVDVGTDMALLKLIDESITFDETPYTIKSESTLQGSKAFVLGYPLTTAMGDEIKITDGLISANSGYKGSLSQYQFSAAIQPGNSGSPLFNEQGEVIGLINSKLSGAESAGYAIKSSYIHTFVNQIEGIELKTISTAIAPATLVEQVQRNKSFVFIVRAQE